MKNCIACRLKYEEVLTNFPFFGDGAKEVAIVLLFPIFVVESFVAVFRLSVEIADAFSLLFDSASVTTDIDGGTDTSTEMLALA